MIVSVFLALALLAASCGSDDGDSSAATDGQTDQSGQSDGQGTGSDGDVSADSDGASDPTPESSDDGGSGSETPGDGSSEGRLGRR